MRDSRRRRSLETVLFTDIVGSTDIAARLGDGRWRALLARHHALVRSEVRRFRGREVDTAGDGFFVTFPTPADGIRCACAAADALRELGVEIRAGVHFGEIEQMKPKVTGLAVVTAARIAALAGRGEVLVSSTVEELVGGSGIAFEDRGPQVLKGVPAARHVFAVTSVDGARRPPPLAKGEAERRLDEIQAPLFARRHRRWIVVAAVVAAAAAASIVALTRSPASPPPIQIHPNSLVQIDPRTNKVTAAVHVVEPGGSQIAVVPPHELWVLSQENQVVSIVDSQTHGVQTLGVFGGLANEQAGGYGIVYAANRVWVSGPSGVIALDPGTRTVVARLHISGAPNLMARGFGRVWVAVHDTELVDAIDPKTARVVLTGHIGPGDNGIGAGEGAVWVGNYVDNTVSKIDPRSGKSKVIRLGDVGGPATIATGFGSTWVSDPRNGIVVRIDPATNRVIRRIEVGKPSTSSYASDIAALAGSMWVVSPASRTIVRIDPATNAVRARIHFPYFPAGLVGAYGKVWATVGTTVP